jgi:hypothetical protein
MLAVFGPLRARVAASAPDRDRAAFPLDRSPLLCPDRRRAAPRNLRTQVHGVPRVLDQRRLARLRRDPFPGPSAAIRRGTTDAQLEDSPLVNYLLPNADDQERWNGTPSALLAEFSEVVGKSVTPSPDWPKSPARLTRELRRIAPQLRTHGIVLKISRGHWGRSCLLHETEPLPTKMSTRVTLLQMKTSVISREPQKSVDTRKSNAAKAVSTRVDTFDPGRCCVRTHRFVLSSVGPGEHRDEADGKGQSRLKASPPKFNVVVRYRSRRARHGAKANAKRVTAKQPRSCASESGDARSWRRQNDQTKPTANMAVGHELDTPEHDMAIEGSKCAPGVSSERSEETGRTVLIRPGDPCLAKDAVAGAFCQRRAGSGDPRPTARSPGEVRKPAPNGEVVESWGNTPAGRS